MKKKERKGGRWGERERERGQEDLTEKEVKISLLQMI